MYTWCLVRRLRMARVFLGRRSSGSSFLFLYASRSAAFCFCEITVSTRAMEVRTTLLQEKKKPRIHASVSVRREPGEIETKKREEGSRSNQARTSWRACWGRRR